MLEMREFLNKKVGKKGFTLAELLVVVAILAVLVAVSIPIFTGQLDKAKASTDAANLRAGKAAAVNAYMEAEGQTGATYYYDAEKGVVGTSSGGITAYGKTDGHSIVKVTITSAGAAEAVWE